MKRGKLKVISIIVFIIVFIAVIIGLLALDGKRKMDILFSVAESVYKFNADKDTNVYIKSKSSNSYLETYKYGNGTEKSIFYDKKEGVKYTYVDNGIEVFQYTESDDGVKIMCIIPYEKKEDEVDEETIVTEDYKINDIGVAGIFDLAAGSLNFKISTDRINGKECYVIKIGSSDVQYVDKATLLPIKSISQYYDENGKMVSDVEEYEYRYDVVLPEDVEPLDPDGFEVLTQEEFDNHELNNLYE